MALSSLTKNKLAKSPATAWLVQPIDTSWMGTFPAKKTTATVAKATVVPKAPIAPAPVAQPTQDSSWIGTFPANGTPKNTTNPAVPSQTGENPPNRTYTDFSQNTDSVTGADANGYQYNADGSMDTVGMGLESSGAYDARMQYAKYLTELTNYDSGYDPEKKYSELQTSEGVTAKQWELDAIDKDIAGQKSAISAIENRARSGYGTLTNDQNSRLIDTESAPSRQVLAQKLLEQEATGQAYNRAKSNADTKLNLYTQAITYKDQQMAKKADLMKQRISALNISDDQRNLMLQKLQIKQAEYKAQTEYARTNGDINSTDPIAKIKAITNAVSQVTSQYKNYPWFIQRPDSVIADVIDTKLASGEYKDLAEAIQKELTDNITAKAEYSQIQDATYNAGKFSTFSNKDSAGNETTYIFDSKTGQYKQVVGNSTGTITTPVSEQSTKYLSMWIGEKGWQCGFYANRAVGLNGEPGGDDSIAGRKQTYTDQSPVVGGLVFFTGSGYDKSNGHVSVVKTINGDGTMTLKESNYKGDETVGERRVPVNSATGFYNSTPLALANNKTSGTGTWPTINGKPLSSDASKLYGYTSTGLRMTDQVEKLVDDMGAREFIARYKAGDPTVATVVSDLSDTVGRIRSGGAVNAEEAKRFEDRFVSSLNMIWNNTASIKNMITSTRKEFQDTQSAMWVTGGSQSTPTNTPESTPAPNQTQKDKLIAYWKSNGWDDAKIQAYLKYNGIQ